MIEREYREKAARLRAAGQIREAANYYVSSAFGYLMKFRHLDGGDHRLSPTKFGYFTSVLLLGALCHRISGNPERARHYSSVGIEVVADIRDNETMYDTDVEAPTGLCQEFIGDFRLVGQLDCWKDAYRTAADHYSTVDNHRQWAAEPEFEQPMITLIELAEGVDYDLTDDTKGRIRYTSLEARIRFKHDHYEEIIQRVVDEGNWESDIQ